MSYYNIRHKLQDAGRSMTNLHTHDFYEIEFLCAGERDYFTTSKMYKLKPPALLVLPPNASHKFETSGCEVYTLQISPESLSEDQLNFLQYLAHQEVIHFPQSKLKKLTAAFADLEKIYNSFPFNAHKKMRFSLRLGMLFAMIDSYAELKGEAADYSLSEGIAKTAAPVILNILDYLHQNYKEDFSLDDLCEQFHISKSYLSSSFARATGTTIFQYKLSLQLEEAKRLCRETRYSYDKIAKMTGFSSGNYFRLIFKKHEGQTPNQHRYNSLEKRNKHN